MKTPIVILVLATLLVLSAAPALAISDNALDNASCVGHCASEMGGTHIAMCAQSMERGISMCAQMTHQECMAMGMHANCMAMA